MQLKTLFWLVLMSLLWGPTFLFIKVAGHDIPPLTLAAARVSLAAGLLYLILRLQGRHLPGFGLLWKHFTMAGLLLNAWPYALIFWSEQYIDSGLAAVLIGFHPLFTMLLAHLFTTEDRLTLTKALGTAVGFGGLVVLVTPTLRDGLQPTTWGVAATLAAALCYAGGTLYTRHKLRGLPPLVAPTAQLLTAALFLVPLALLFEPPAGLSRPAGSSLVALLALVVISTVLTFMIYYRAMERLSATSLSSVTYLIPVVGLGLGVLLLNERPGWPAYLGCGLVIAGMMLGNGLFQSHRLGPSRHPLSAKQFALFNRIPK